MHRGTDLTQSPASSQSEEEYVNVLHSCLYDTAPRGGLCNNQLYGASSVS